MKKTLLIASALILSLNVACTQKEKENVQAKETSVTQETQKINFGIHTNVKTAFKNKNIKALERYKKSYVPGTSEAATIALAILEQEEAKKIAKAEAEKTKKIAKAVRTKKTTTDLTDQKTNVVKKGKLSRLASFCGITALTTKINNNRKKSALITIGTVATIAGIYALYDYYTTEKANEKIRKARKARRKAEAQLQVA